MREKKRNIYKPVIEQSNSIVFLEKQGYNLHFLTSYILHFAFFLHFTFTLTLAILELVPVKEL